MHDRFLQHGGLFGAAGVALAAAAGARWGTVFTVGIAAGGLWQLVNLWCLARALGAWLSPQPPKGRSLVWLVVKFPLLYAAAVVVLRHPLVSPVGFGVGFVIMLTASMAVGLGIALRGSRPLAPHGR